MERCEVCRSESSQREPGWVVCFSCGNRVLRWLREVEEYLPKLSLIKPVGHSEPVSGPGFGSRSPANDSVIHHTDWRSGWDELDGHGALGVIGSWAAMVREERGLKPPKRPTLTTEAHVLRDQHSWIMRQDWAAEYSSELRGVWVAVRALACDPVPKPVGKCIRFHNSVECRGDVFELSDASGVRCSRCKALYTGLDLLRFRHAQEVSS